MQEACDETFHPLTKSFLWNHESFLKSKFGTMAG